MTDLSEVRLIRTGGDSWDITESVGVTEAMDSVLLTARLEGARR